MTAPQRSVRRGIRGRDRGGVMFKLLVLLAVLGAAGALAWMLFLPAFLAAQLRERTGFTVELRSLVANPFTGLIDVRGLVLSNPPGFPAGDFVQLREFRLEADLTTLLSDRPVFDAVTLDVARITLVKQADGRTNAEAFQRAPVTGSTPPAAPRCLIRRLDLQFDRLVVVDHSGPVPVVREFEVGVKGTYRAVTDLQPLLSPEVWQALAPLGAALDGLVPENLGQAVRRAAKEAAKTGAERLRAAGQRTGESVKGYLEALEENKKP